MSRRSSVSIKTLLTLAITIVFSALGVGAAYDQRGIHGVDDVGTRFAPPVILDVPKGVDVPRGIDMGAGNFGTSNPGSSNPGSSGGNDDRRAAEKARAAAISEQTARVTNYLKSTRQQDISALPIVQKMDRAKTP